MENFLLIVLVYYSILCSKYCTKNPTRKAKSIRGNKLYIEIGEND